MKKIYFYFALALYIFQLYWTIDGVNATDKYRAPIILFTATFGLCVLYFWSIWQAKTVEITLEVEDVSSRHWIQAMIGIISVAATAPLYKKLFLKHINYSEMSDVIGQNEALYYRSITGIQPYFPLETFAHKPFPVYMPLHWMPISISHVLGIDIRWSGFILLCFLTGLACFWASRRFGFKAYYMLLAILPSLGFWEFGVSKKHDLAITYEFNIAAYYLILGMALATRHFWGLVLGVVCCLLSRYTFLFWLPLLALILYKELPLRQNIKLWATVVAAFLLLYVFPFLLREPNILKVGVTYHNEAAIGDWIGTGAPDFISWTQEAGVSFSIFMKERFSGTYAHRVYLSRIVQGSLMLLVFFAGLLLYFTSWRKRVHYYDFLLGFLYLQLLLFYNFGPLTYRYYLISMMVLSSVLVIRLAALHRSHKS